MKNVLFSLYIILTGLNITFAFSVPSAIWPQKETKEFQAGQSSAKHKILIIATSSPFKDSVIKSFTDSITKDNTVYVNVVGMKKILAQKIDNWNAIVIVNTCMAWQIDNRVQKFIKNNESYKGFVVLTTSGDPKECGSEKKEFKNIDAISSASIASRSADIMRELLRLVREKF